MKDQSTTLRDIALKLGVSVSTVSRALNNAPEVNKRTKEAVMEMARALNYAPNHVAQSLRSNKTKTIGIIIPNLISHFFSATISGIQETAVREGYNIMIAQSNESFETEVSNVQMMLAQRVDGILISLSRETKSYDHLEAVLQRGIPLVFFDRVCDSLPASRVMVDNQEGAFKATELLINSGCQRIAHIAGPPQLSISRSRLQGYRDAHEAYGLPYREEFIRHTDLTEEETALQIQALLEADIAPDAIFAFTDLAATQAMQMVKQYQKKVPQDIAIIGFTNTPVSAFIEPALTTVAQPAYEIGQIAARHLLDQIWQPQNFVPQSIVLQTTLIIRESTRPVLESVPSGKKT